MKQIKVLGTSCPRCEKLFEHTVRAVKELGLDGEVEKVTDISEMMHYGILITPALVVDEDVKSSGKVLSPDEIKKLIS